MKKIILLFCLLMIAGGMFWALGFRINATDSIPKGVYRIIQKTPEKGDYVLFCPPDESVFKEARTRGYLNTGFCQGGYEALMKKVAETAGDRISIDSDGVWVNGKHWPQSEPLVRDQQGRPMPKINIKSRLLKDDEYLLMGEHPASFDARYFGIMKKNKDFKTIQQLTWRK